MLRTPWFISVVLCMRMPSYCKSGLISTLVALGMDDSLFGTAAGLSDAPPLDVSGICLCESCTDVCVAPHTSSGRTLTAGCHP
jgi:hypothetical protein